MIWTVVAIALAVLALANLFLLLGVAARLRLLHRAARVRPPLDRLPEVGRAIRAFEVEGTSGDLLTDRAFAAGTTIVGFFATGCRKCARLRAALVETPPVHPTVVMINGDPGDAETLAMGAPLVDIGRIAYFEDLGVARAFGVLGYPTLLRVEDGRIAAVGRALEDVGAAA
jgi:hypothetical protein